MGNLVILDPKVDLDVDEGLITRLAQDLGHTVAHNLLANALEDLASRLTCLQDEFARADHRALRQSARALVPVAGQIGLRGVVRAARGVADCVDTGDPVALAATFARLQKGGQAALAAATVPMEFSL